MSTPFRYPRKDLNPRWLGSAPTSWPPRCHLPTMWDSYPASFMYWGKIYFSEEGRNGEGDT